jgi:DNA-binding CsgD family transcriptional regulator
MIPREHHSIGLVMKLPDRQEARDGAARIDPTNPWEVDPATPWALAWPAGLFVIITFFVGADMAADLSAGIGFVHLGIETIAVMFCLAGVWGSGLQLRRALQRSRDLHKHLAGTHADLIRAREEAEVVRAGLGAALDEQFERWELTSAQREVALLVLKGLSYKEVADLRQTAEHTVRNQALAIFKKAGLAGRAEMAAFFMEDLLLPREPVRLRAANGGASAPQTGDFGS